MERNWREKFPFEWNERAEEEFVNIKIIFSLSLSIIN